MSVCLPVLAGSSGCGVAVLETLGVVLNELLLAAMAIRGIEVKVEHFGISLIERPVIVIEAIYRAHDPSAVTAARAVHVELAGLRVVDDLQKLGDLGIGRIFLVRNRDIHIG